MQKEVESTELQNSKEQLRLQAQETEAALKRQHDIKLQEIDEKIRKMLQQKQHEIVALQQQVATERKRFQEVESVLKELTL